MEKNIIIAGVGGQGILSVAYVICNAALEEGLFIKQAEVHGMAQRGGAVQSNLRLSDKKIASDLIPAGKCDLILSVEPLEALRYLQYLHKDGEVITSVSPKVNIPNYPEMENIWSEFSAVPNFLPIDADRLAKESGSGLASGTVILGAAFHSLPLKTKTLERWVSNLWEKKGDRVVETNLKAFHAGQKMAETLIKARRDGKSHEELLKLSIVKSDDSAPSSRKPLSSQA